MDGCFDMMHFGHANALRQARALGDVLVVGVHSDAEITRNKGPPVMNERERYQAVRACKWADEVVEDAPYTTELAWLERYNIDFVVHGDDLVLNADGTDCYAAVKAAGKVERRLRTLSPCPLSRQFRTVPRTPGVSTTDLVGRMLLVSKDHLHQRAEPQHTAVSAMASPYTRVTKFVPTSRKIVDFSAFNPERRPTDRAVYVDGGFDLFHVGHIAFLQAARAHGTYLIVGIHSDEDIHAHKGANFPIMTLQERVLGVLSCRYVDEVIIGAPYAITAEIIDSLQLAVVCSGRVGCDDPNDAYKVARERGLWRQVDSPSTLTSTDVIQRILDNFNKYAERNRKKEARELNSIAAPSAEKKAKTDP